MPLTEEEVAYLLGLTNPYYWQTPTLDLHHTDAGIWSCQYNESMLEISLSLILPLILFVSIQPIHTSRSVFSFYSVQGTFIGTSTGRCLTSHWTSPAKSSAKESPSESPSQLCRPCRFLRSSCMAACQTAPYSAMGPIRRSVRQESSVCLYLISASFQQHLLYLWVIYLYLYHVLTMHSLDIQMSWYRPGQCH